MTAKEIALTSLRFAAILLGIAAAALVLLYGLHFISDALPAPANNSSVTYTGNMGMRH